MHIDDVASEDEITNSPYLRKLKRQMMAGEWPRNCERCEMLERHGSKSMRQWELEKYRESLSKLLSQTEADGTSPAELSYYGLQLGNVCNLQCRMCGPFNSTRWISEYHLITGSKEEDEVGRDGSFSWPQKETNFDLLFEQLPHVDLLSFAGGEPLIVQAMIKLLRRCVEAGEAHHVALNYNTNVTRIPDEVRELWPKFKSVSLICSVDAYGRLNDYIRYPARWQEIHNNLVKLDANFHEYNCNRIFIQCTVQAYNILGLDDLFDYIACSFTSITPFPVLIPLVYPPYFDIRIMPNNLKRFAIERLEQARTKHAAIWSLSMNQSVDAIIGLIGEEMSGSEKLIDEFKRVTSSLDRHRNESLFSVAPEVASAVGLAAVSNTLSERRGEA